MFITKKLLPTYLKFIVPTMLTFTLVSVYSIVDGVFVGNAVGDAGLAGINVAYPLVQLLFAVATGIGMGGGVIASINAGKGDMAKSRRAIGTTVCLLALASIPLMVACMVFAEPLSYLLGGRGETLAEAKWYLGAIMWGAPFQILTTGCLPLVRNKGKVGYAMAVSVVGGLANIFLDWVFVMVFGWGTAGAGWATALSQALSFVLVLAFFLRPGNRIAKADLRIDGSIARHIAKLGLSPFGLTLLPEFTVIFINNGAVLHGGEVAVAAYAVIAYVACVVQMLIQGIGDGSQPLISKTYGAGDHDTVRRLRNTNWLATYSIAIVGISCVYLARHAIPVLFGTSADAAELVAWAMPLFSVCYLFFAFTHASTSFFYAIDNPRSSTAIVVGEAALIAPCVFGLGAVFGLNGVWCAPSMVQFLLMLLAIFLLRRNSKRTARARNDA